MNVDAIYFRLFGRLPKMIIDNILLWAIRPITRLADAWDDWLWPRWRESVIAELLKLPRTNPAMAEYEVDASGDLFDRRMRPADAAALIWQNLQPDDVEAD